MKYIFVLCMKYFIKFIFSQMNDKRSKDSTRYACLQEQEVHTLTSALKLFFRETSDLIPEEVFNIIPKSLDLPDSIQILRVQLHNKLELIPKMTLKYLIRHLKT